MKASADRLYKDVAALTSIEPARHYQNYESLEKATSYITEQLQQLGLTVTEQPFKVDGHTYKNISALLPGAGEARVVVGAHYDVCGDQPGADDNASGIAGLLETARLLTTLPALPYPIELVAFCLEEPPFFATENMGSAVHAKSLHQAGTRVKSMICYEMIGYFSDVPGSQRFPDETLKQYYPHEGNFIAVVGNAGQQEFTQRFQKLMQPHAAIDVQAVNLPQAYGLVGLSDHRNYWKYGIEAIMINDSSFLRNPNYHQKTDTIDTLDFKRMAEVVTGTTRALTQL
ncbi:M28 family peptidase [Pontibacter sp. SGAir0037]|uniref:M28 family peptidase n=1 Tax=Pontibacter sp. SGAir0037 TaxID=2571030 RepID=UPI0010CD55A7|nr:M28 family peptidase [Pontibacter sp. SGAir0037]QCR25053.1 peptidase M28 [Pontibacter sp. SGAir0037]